MPGGSNNIDVLNAHALVTHFVESSGFVWDECVELGYPEAACHKFGNLLYDNHGIFDKNELAKLSSAGFGGEFVGVFAKNDGKFAAIERLRYYNEEWEQLRPATITVLTSELIAYPELVVYIADGLKEFLNNVIDDPYGCNLCGEYIMRIIAALPKEEAAEFLPFVVRFIESARSIDSIKDGLFALVATKELGASAKGLLFDLKSRYFMFGALYAAFAAIAPFDCWVNEFLISGIADGAICDLESRVKFLGRDQLLCPTSDLKLETSKKLFDMAVKAGRNAENYVNLVRGVAGFGERAFPMLKEMLVSENKMQVIAALDTIFWMGPVAMPLFDTLVDMSEYYVPEVRKALIAMGTAAVPKLIDLYFLGRGMEEYVVDLICRINEMTSSEKLGQEVFVDMAKKGVDGRASQTALIDSFGSLAQMPTDVALMAELAAPYLTSENVQLFYEVSSAMLARCKGDAVCLPQVRQMRSRLEDISRGPAELRYLGSRLGYEVFIYEMSVR